MYVCVKGARVKRDGTYLSFLPYPIIRNVEKFVRRFSGFIMFLTRPLISVSASRKLVRECRGLTGIRERVDDKALSSSSISTLSSIFAKVHDSLKKLLLLLSE